MKITGTLNVVAVGHWAILDLDELSIASQQGLDGGSDMFRECIPFQDAGTNMAWQSHN